MTAMRSVDVAVDVPPAPAEELLLVEDSESDAMLVRALLGRSAWSATSLRHTLRLAEALAADQPAPSCVLLDLSLPDSHGLETLDRIIERFPTVPVVILTGNADSDTATDALRAGAEDYLIKGRFDSETLERTIRFAIQRKQAHLAVEAERRLNRAVLDAIDAQTAILDSTGRIIAVNRRWTSFAEDNGADPASTGVGADYLAVCRRTAASPVDAEGATSGTDVAELAGRVADQLEAMLRGQLDDFQAEYACHSPAAERWFMLRATSLGAGMGAVLMHVPITDQKRLHLRLEQLAQQDTLTGVANRAGMLDRLRFLLVQRDPPGVAVAFVDLDGFKPINDRHGHAAGDEILREMGRRLTAATRAGDVVGRWGGDEFVVVAHAETEAAAAAFGSRLSRVLSGRWAVAGDQVDLSASVGVYLVDTGTPADAGDVIAAADAAMYQAKQTGPAGVCVVRASQVAGTST